MQGGRAVHTMELEQDPWPTVRHAGGERRQSLRVDLDPGLPVLLDGFDQARLIEVSLGGCILETRRRIQAGVWSNLELPYQNGRTILSMQTYQSFLHELFYSDAGTSRICYRSRAVFSDPSIESLNLLYRIMADHWPGSEERL